jgi:NodT family efflux transporter outer membrane factor (OMF) lipoprotein
MSPRPSNNGVSYRKTPLPRIVALGCAALILAGCAAGPNFQQPPEPSQTAYEAGAPPAATASAGGPDGAAQHFDRGAELRADWYTLFGSPALDALIAQGLANSPTLTAARARLAAAKEAVSAAAGGRRPQVDADAGAHRRRATGTIFGITNPEFTNTFNIYEPELSASYDVDAFGALARRVESAQAEAEVQRYRLLGSRMTLVDNIVAGALAEAGARATLAATQAIVDAQRKSVALIEQKEQLGAALHSDVLSAQAQLADTEASLPLLHQRVAAARHRLALLTGQAPADYHAPALALQDFTLPTQLPLSVPAALVRQRPDVLAAASVMHAELARVGIAGARLLPDVRIDASYGRGGLNASDLLDPSAAIWRFGAELLAPVFHGGTLRAQKRAAQDRYDAAAADYRNTVLTALEQVADRLRALDSDAQALRSRRQSLEAAGQALTLVRGRYGAGAADFLDLYQAQAQQQRAVIAYTRARLQRYLDTAGLFRALGGGWWNGASADGPRQDGGAATASLQKGFTANEQTRRTRDSR